MKTSLPKPGRRRASGASTFRGRGGQPSGFSLVELLVVIFIMAILFLIGGREISKSWKRQKLQSASLDIKALMQRALPEMQRRNMVTFVQIGPLVNNAAVRYLPIYLIGDANGNGAIDVFANPAPAGKDLLIDEYDIVILGKTGVKGVTGASPDFCLSVANVMEIQSALWSDNSTDWTKARALMCDFQGRAVDVTTGRQLAGPATVVLTHVDVVSGDYQPPTRFILSLNPVWSVRTLKQTTKDNPTDPAAVWEDQLGG